MTQLSQYTLDRTIAMGTADLGLKTPYVQQFSFGVQQELKSFVVEARYVGTRGTQLLRDGQPLCGPDDRHTTLYRFVFPVKRE